MQGRKGRIIIIKDKKENITTPILQKIAPEEKTNTCIDTREQLRACQERYQELLNNMKIGVAIYETPDKGKTFYVKDFNRGAEFIEKVKSSEVIGKRIDEVFPGIHQFGLVEVLQRVYRTGLPEHHPIGLYSDEWIRGWRDNYVYRLSSGGALPGGHTLAGSLPAGCLYRLSGAQSAVIVVFMPMRGTMDSFQMALDQKEDNHGYNGHFLDFLHHFGTAAGFAKAFSRIDAHAQDRPDRAGARHACHSPGAPAGDHESSRLPADAVY
jgi:hypothetical protein